MECLEIPVDHRLIKIIKRVNVPPHEDRSSHLEVLEAFSRTAKRRENPITEEESHHASELAGPDTKGGVLITLLRPPRNQRFDHGYSAEVSRCRTTRAVADLISNATNQQLTIDDVSVFDTSPFSPEGFDDAQLVREAEAAFSRMVKVKEPDIILCCYQGRSSNDLVNALRSFGVGKVFSVPWFKISSDCEVQRINAFHPSYAVNYNPTYSCFRRLLLLEFTYAFCNLSGQWQEEQWMKNLRLHCRKTAQKIGKEQEIQAHEKLSRRDLIMSRWKGIIDALNSSFSTMQYFRPNISSSQTQQRLDYSSLSWHCADAYLFLDKFGDTEDGSDYAGILLDSFQTWCKETCLPIQPKIISNNEDKRGFYEQQYLTEAVADSSDHFTRRLQNCYLSLLKGVNLSYRRVNDGRDRFRFDIRTQKDAFIRFSRSLERESSRNVPIHEEIESLTIH